MARGNVLLILPGRKEPRPWGWKTDLKGYGSVHVGEEFTARETLCNKLMKGGMKLKVRVVAIEGHYLRVEILQDLTAARTKTTELF